MFKNFNLDDLVKITKSLIDESEDSITSSLDIKNQLRVDGFWATQRLVSKALKEMVDDIKNGIERIHNGSYFEYIIINDNGTNNLPEVNEDKDSDNSDSEIVDSVQDDSTNVVSKKGKNKVISVKKVMSNLFKMTLGNDNFDEINVVVTCVENLMLNDKYKKHYIVIDSKNPSKTWFLFTDKPEEISRHQAMYYTWYLLKECFDSNVKYADMRTTKQKQPKITTKQKQPNITSITGSTF